MRSLALLPLALVACIADRSPYDGGGEYPTSECTRGQRQLVASTAGEQLWEDAPSETDGVQRGRTRDFSLLDHHGYRVRLTHFCGDTVLLVVGSMQDPTDPDAPGPIDWFDDLPSWLDERDPAAPAVTVMATWHANVDGEVPTVGDLRRFRDVVEDFRGEEAFAYDQPASDGGTRQILTLQDPFRFEDAAAAASAMYVVTDVPPDPDPTRRYRREHEVRDRWRHRSEPFFVVLDPVLRIVALGDDPVEDGIMEALQGSSQ